MPAGIGNAYVFQVFNTISFSTVLGAPMILFFKHMAASATVLGIVVALTPLMNILQIPAARFVERVGYRAFVLRGWTIRSLFIMGMAVTAFLPAKIDTTTRIALMLFLLFAYNTSRGISVCGFLPWLTHLVPEQVRGRFVSGDQISGNMANLFGLLTTAWYLEKFTSQAAFGGLFLASFLSGLVSLYFLRRIPDAPISEESRNRAPVPWREMIRYQPFIKLMIYNFIYQSVFAAASVFWIPFLRDDFGVTDSQMLEIAAIGNAVGSVSLFIFGKIIDHTGSKPMLALSGIFLTVHFAGWCAVGSLVLPFTFGTILFQQITSGIGASLFQMANTRLVMGTVPAMGRSHFFALFSVANSLTLGFLPIIWGIVLDSLHGWHSLWWLWWDWNNYSLLYWVLSSTCLIGLFYLRKLTEPKAMTTEAFMQELFIKTPGRALTRLLTRRIFF